MALSELGRFPIMGYSKTNHSEWSLFGNMLTCLEVCVDQNGGLFEHVLK